MKKLIFTFALAIFLIPGVVNASTLDLRLVSFRWNNGQQSYNSTDIISESINNIWFYGVKRTYSTAYQWPYTDLIFQFNKPTFDTSKTYDITFVSYISQNANIQTIARINNTANTCTTVSESGNMTFFSCKDVTFLNNDSNYIVVSFKNNLSSSTSFLAALTKLNIAPSNESNTDEIIQYMQIMEQNQKNQNQAIIDNQDKNNQEQIDNANKNHEEMKDTLTNGDTSGASSTGSSFFDSFKDTDNGGLSGIITAPLKLINQMLNDDLYERPICTKWLNSNSACIPSGNWIWAGKSKELINFVNLIETGLLSYWILIDLYKTIERIKNPEEDKVEVMNL